MFVYTPLMCGRFALYSPYPKFARRVGAVVSGSDPVPRYNIPPGTWITAVRQPDGNEPPLVDELWWSYAPKWFKGKARQVINARVETVGTSGFFKASYERRRCLIPADGWYEWLKTTTPKTPHYLTRTDREPLFFAGVYAERADGTLGCAIITEQARGAAEAVHGRMPLILDDDCLEPWLDPELTDRESIRNLAQHIDAKLIEHWAVSTAVNKPSEDQGAELINPA